MTVNSLIMQSMGVSRAFSPLCTVTCSPWVVLRPNLRLFYVHLCSRVTQTPPCHGEFLSSQTNVVLKNQHSFIHNNIFNKKNKPQILDSSISLKSHKVYHSNDSTKDGGNGDDGIVWYKRTNVISDTNDDSNDYNSKDNRGDNIKEDNSSKLKEYWEEEGVICKHCDIGFSNEVALQSHIDATGKGGGGGGGCKALWLKRNKEDVNNGKLPYICKHEGCGIGFKYRSQLDSHKASHSDDRPFICSECGSSHKLLSHLNQHIKQKHSGQVFQCPECDKTFNSDGEVKSHLKFCRQEEKEFKCSQCGLKFHRNSDLTKHINHVHNKEKPYKCKLCDARFTTNTVLKKHMNAVHENVRPYQCEDCNAAFNTAAGLNNHRIRMHTFDWPHVCHICEKGFIAPGKLEKHMEAQHPAEYQEQLEREKPAVCPQCGKRFENKKQVEIHVRKKHSPNSQYLQINSIF